MSLSIECRYCGQIINPQLGDALRTLIDCEKHNSIFTGFYCTECGEALEKEFDEED
ncbi:MAG: hypothetical protein AB9856_00010 [Cellulosilyticaceae bacterium]